MEEEKIKVMFLKAFNRLQAKTVLEDVRLMYDYLTDYSELDRQITEITDELTVVAGMVKNLIRDNSNRVQPQADYEERYSALESRYNAAKDKLDELQVERSRRERRELDLKLFLKCLQKNKTPQEEWSDELWLAAVRQGTVFRDGSIEFEFKDGQKIKVEA